MNSQMHPMNGKAKGANARRRPSLMLRLMLMLMAMAGASQAWAQTACFPVVTDPATPTAVVYMGQTPTVTLALNPANGDFVANSPGYDIVSDNPAVLTPNQTSWGPNDCSQSITIPLNLNQPGTAILSICETGGSCTSPEDTVQITVNPLGGGAYTITAIAGDNQTLPSGSTLTPLEVFLEQATAGCSTCPLIPATGEEIYWEVSPPAASTTPTLSTFTGTSGHAQATIAIAPTYVGPFTITATVENDPSVQYTFSATATSIGSSYTLDYVSGDAQSAYSGQALPAPLVVALSNDLGNSPSPVPNATINWTVSPTSAANVPSFSTTTDASGTSQAYITISSDFTGGFTITAQSADDPNASYTFVAEAVQRTYELSRPQDSGDGATVPLGGQITLRALVTSNDSPASNRAVLWTVMEGTASPLQRTANSDGSGISSVSFTFGQTPGITHIQAMLMDDSNQVQDYFVTVEGTPSGEPLVLVKADTDSGDGQTGTTGQTLAQPLRVQVLQGGSGVSGATIDWAITSGNASLDASSSVSDANGFATMSLTFGSQPGTVGIHAAIHGSSASDVNFSVSSQAPTAPDVVTLSLVSGDGQSTQAGSALPQALVISVMRSSSGCQIGEDQGCPPVPDAGATVVWTVTPAAASSTPISTSTVGSDGRASIQITTASNYVGAFTVRAEHFDEPNVAATFHATTTAAPVITTLEIVSGNGQANPVGWPSAPLVVRVLDGAGNPVSGLTIAFTATNATVTPTTAVTDAQGQASTIANITNPSPAQITARIQGQEAAVVFMLNGGLSGIPILTDRQRAYARAMDTMWPALRTKPTLTPEEQDLAARCLELIQIADSGQTDVQGALGAMAQDTAPTQANAAISANTAQFDNIASRIVALRGGASGVSLGGLSLGMPNGGLMPLSFLPSAVLSKAAADATAGNDPGFSRWGFFATGTIGRGKRDDHGENAGYDFDTAGITAGFDYRVRDNLVLGVSVGYTKQNTDLAQGGGEVKTDGLSLSFYGSWYSEKSWYLDAVLTHGRNSYDMKRHINYSIQTAQGGTSTVNQMARSDGDGTQTALSLSVGRDIQKGAWSISPYLRGNLTRIDFDGYEEAMLDNQPGEGLALGVESRDLDSRTLVFGSRFAYTMSRDWGILTPHMHLEWEHEFKDDPDQITAYFRYDPLRTPIQIEGEALDSNYANVGIGLSALFPKGRSAFLLYEKMLGASHLSRDTISIGVRMEF
ncbi:MAG: autotransporter domain-containing protein [Lysobacteraceae bacterium]